MVYIILDISGVEINFLRHGVKTTFFKRFGFPLRILGMMSGTSGDGIDGALVQFEKDGSFSLLWHQEFPFDANIRTRLKKLMNGCSEDEIALANSWMALLYSAAVEKFRKAHVDKIDCIAAHGQTLAHIPQKRKWGGVPLTGTLQALSGSWLAEKTGLPVIYDFRSRDMAVGGQGAPLVPFGDLRFFGGLPGDTVALNVGGIANITVIRRLPKPKVVSAFDVGPGNLLMDALATKISSGKNCFDRDGKIAAAGKTCRQLLEELMEDPFFELVPPKSTGRDRFGQRRFESIWKKWNRKLSPQDLMSSLLNFTVEGIASSLEKYVLPNGKIDRMIVAGGGAKNYELIRRLKMRLRGKMQIRISDEFGVPASAREAMAFAALGEAFLRGIPAGIPAATGAKQPVILGAFAP